MLKDYHELMKVRGNGSWQNVPIKELVYDFDDILLKQKQSYGDMLKDLRS